MAAKKETLAQKINKGMQSARKAFANLNEVMMHKMTKDAWHEVVEDRERLLAQIHELRDELQHKMGICHHMLGDMHKDYDHSTDGLGQIGPLSGERLVEAAVEIHVILEKIELLRNQVRKYNVIIDPSKEV